MADAAPPPGPPPISVRRIGLAALASLVAALLVFAGAVLPAEYGVDPLGTGDLFGLLALAQVVAVTAEEDEYRTDAVELTLRPEEWVEYTYRIQEGAAMLYSWRATGPLAYNLHSALPTERPPATRRASTPRRTTSPTGATLRRSPAFMAGTGRTSGPRT